MLADSMEWEWSGGVKGKGSKEDYYAVMAGSWQAVVSSFHASNIFPIVDTTTGTIAVPHEILININGRGNGPDCFFQGRNIFTFTVFSKVASFRGLWDPNNAEMNKCLASATAKKEL